jgi:hypothetical protein
LKSEQELHAIEAMGRITIKKILFSIHFVDIC